MKALDTHLAFLDERELPPGPPLNLEQVGRATSLLTPFVLPERIQRLTSVIEHRTRRITLLLERVHDAHNVAACARTCDAFGLQDLHIIPPEDKPLRFSKLVSSGAHRWLTVHVHDTLDSALQALRSSGYMLAVTDVSSEAPCDTPASLPLDAPLCVAFGNERDGVSQALRAAADMPLHIPMTGFVESFNVSVAVAIACSRLRERIDAMPPAAWQLSTSERAALMDTWVIEDVPHAHAVLMEIARRHSEPPCPD